MPDEDKLTQFDGTRWECEAFLNSYFSWQRWITEGALESAIERGEEENERHYREVLGSLDREVFRVIVEPLGFAVTTPIRPENAVRAMRIQTALDIYDAIFRKNGGVTGGMAESHDDRDSSDDNTDTHYDMMVSALSDRANGVGIAPEMR